MPRFPGPVLLAAALLAPAFAADPKGSPPEGTLPVGADGKPGAEPAPPTVAKPVDPSGRAV